MGFTARREPKAHRLVVKTGGEPDRASAAASVFIGFYPIYFPPKRIAKVQNHKERQARRVQNIVIARQLPAQSVQKAFAIINSATEQDFTKV